MIGVLLNKDGSVTAKGDGKRPPGSVSGSQGEHTTPYTMLEHELVNAMNGQTAANAWTSLLLTHKVYQSLPGYEDALKWLVTQSEMILVNMSAVDPATVDVNTLATYANNLLAIRNRLAYTSIKSKGGVSIGGKNEANTAGALHYLERELRGGKATKYTKSDVLKTSWEAFDHTNLARVNSEKQQAIVQQHAVTVHDAYPVTMEHFGISANDILKAYH